MSGRGSIEMNKIYEMSDKDKKIHNRKVAKCREERLKSGRRAERDIIILEISFYILLILVGMLCLYVS